MPQKLFYDILYIKYVIYMTCVKMADAKMIFEVAHSRRTHDVH